MKWAGTIVLPLCPCQSFEGNPTDGGQGGEHINDHHYQACPLLVRKVGDAPQGQFRCIVGVEEGR